MTLADLPLSVRVLSPELLLVAAGGVLAVVPRKAGLGTASKRVSVLAILAVAAAAGAWMWVVPDGEAFAGRLAATELSKILGLLILGGAGLTLLATLGAEPASLAGRRLPLLLWILATVLLALRSQDLVPLGVALAIASLGSSGWFRPGDPRRSEHAQSAWVVTATFIYATAILYGETGATRIDAIAGAFAVGLTGSTVLAHLGLFLLLLATLWRGGLVPFHRGATALFETVSPAVFFLTTVLRVLGLSLLARLLTIAVYAADLPRFRGILVLGAASMMLGSLVAVARRDLPGTFGYLLLAHLGMAILPLASPEPQLRGVIYAAATAVAAAVATVVGIADLGRRQDFAGLGRHRPSAALGLLLSLAALSGLPLTAGFGNAWTAAQWALGQDLPILAAGVLASCCLGLLLTVRIGRDLFRQGVEKQGRDTMLADFASSAGSRLALSAAGAALIGGGVIFLLRLA
ncbi:MAG: proton-conducting transporter membrane subunit [Acidobacteriota bacterium]